MKIVFLDTVGLIAIMDTSDQWHEKASAAWEKVVVSGCRYVTTSAVLLECGNAMARTDYRRVVCNLHDELAEHGNLIEPNAVEKASAWAAYARGEAGSASIVDHLSFEVMRRVGAAEAFTNDQHFEAAGFRVLI